MPKVYKVGIVFEFEPQGEHEDLFEDMNEDQMVADMIRMVNQDIASGYGSVGVIAVEEVKE